MTPVPIFHSNDMDEAQRFVSSHPFAVLAVNGASGPMSALVPLIIEPGSEKLLGHVARQNSFWSAAQATKLGAIAVFNGPESYVSPSNYPSKQEHGRVVPTWNYMAVQISGAIQVETDASKMHPYFSGLSDKMEAGRERPWGVADAPKDYIDKLSRGIVGISIKIEEISFVKKLSQDKKRDDKIGVYNAFQSSSSDKQIQLAAEMKRYI